MAAWWNMGAMKWKAGAVIAAGAAGWLVPLSTEVSAAAGVSISFGGALVTTEAGATATFSVALEEAPTGTVTISLATSDDTEGTVSPSQLTFDPTTWNVPVSVTVTGVDDTVDDGDISYEVVTGAAVSDDPAYSGLDVPDLTFVNRDDEDTPGFVITPGAALTTLESRTTATFTIALASRPAADVAVSHTSTDTTEGTVSPASSTFTVDNWNVAQTVTVTGVDDTLVDSDVDYQIDQASASADPIYNALPVAPVLVTNLDDETPAVLIVPVGDQVTTEAGGSATYQMRLSSRPRGGEVVIDLQSSDLSEGRPSIGIIHFTAANWNVLKTVTITGVDDSIDDGDVRYHITHTIVTGDPRYIGLQIPSAELTNFDNDASGVRFSPSAGLRTRENGTASFTVVLLSEPVAPVTVTHTTSNSNEGTVSPARTDFNATNWNVPQTVVIRGVSDGIGDGDVNFFIEHQVISDDPTYSTLAIPRQRVVSEDDGVGAPTTTIAPSTTVRVTTTAVPTTTAAPSTTTTVVTTTTTTEVASQPAVTTTTVRVSATGALPRTGTDPARIALAATFALVAGVIVQLVSRRRSPSA